jgi:hypothetical protein
MTPDILQLLVSAGGSTAIAGAAIWGIIRMVEINSNSQKESQELFAKDLRETREAFGKLITEHHRDNIKSNKEVAKQLAEATKANRELANKVEFLTNAAQSVYVQSAENVKKLKIQDQIIESLNHANKQGVKSVEVKL